MSLLAARRALVTGASSGIGRAVALALAQRGACVALTGRDAPRLLQAAEAARCAGAARVVEIRADLAETSGVEVLAGRVEACFGGLDVLVHSAGVIGQATAAADPALALDAALSIHVRAPYLLTRRLLPALIESRGEIVFVNSSIVDFPRADAALYAASKHALRGIADCLRQEVNPHAVRVLSIFPGRTATAGQERLHALEGRAYRASALLQPEEVAASICHALELPRTAEITEIHIRPLEKT